LTATTALATLFAGFASHAAYALSAGALPQGATVGGGGATFSNPSSTSLAVNQSTERTVIDWQSFNIGSGASVQFNQPDSSALAVNRVVGTATDPTQILGTLKSNGQVMILDPNGVLFGRNARIDVGGIIASTGSVDTAQVMSGANGIDITNIGGGSVVNQGQITAAQGGLVALVAPYAENSGVITANLGRVELASGNAVTVDLSGDNLVSMAVTGPVANALVENSGTITANGGRVAMTARAAAGVVGDVVNMTGVVQANTVGQQNGEIVLSGGSAGTVNVAGHVNATGGAAGGRVDVTGNQIALNDAQVNVDGTSAGGQVYLGAGLSGAQDGTDTPAVTTDVSAGSVINADATNKGNGGTVVVWGSQHTGFYGTATARGGTKGGNGGMVEVSTGAGVDFAGIVNTTAANGKVGQLLIDPASVSIGTGSQTVSGSTYLDAQNIADTMVYTAVNIQATSNIDVINNIDLSTSANGTPTYGLTLGAPTFNLDHNMNMSATSPLHLDFTAMNLNGHITSGGADISATQASGTATQVNILSNLASIQQGMDLSSASSPVTVSVASGQYNENLTVNKAGLTLSGIVNASGAGADATAPELSGTVAGGNIITVAANNVTIDGFHLNAQVSGGTVANSAYGVYASGVDSLTVSQNTFDGFSGTGVSTPSSTNVALTSDAYVNVPTTGGAGGGGTGGTGGTGGSGKGSGGGHHHGHHHGWRWHHDRDWHDRRDRDKGHDKDGRWEHDRHDGLFGLELAKIKAALEAQEALDHAEDAGKKAPQASLPAAKPPVKSPEDQVGKPDISAVQKVVDETRVALAEQTGATVANVHTTKIDAAPHEDRHNDARNHKKKEGKKEAHGANGVHH
ncbi:MAG: filamentous hemagglutinin N-terminal domain-containing protein, partial [Alphaproteobacteria bacterium]|nr:filamentous hemagglutinin N-terminal domain-containing protein [Alphaproteobacteria bacterium]